MSEKVGAPVTDPELMRLLEQAAQRQMTPEEIRQQRRSYVAAEMAIGDDCDEAAYRAALASGDAAELARLDAEDVRRSTEEMIED